MNPQTIPRVGWSELNDVINATTKVAGIRLFGWRGKLSMKIVEIDNKDPNNTELRQTSRLGRCPPDCHAL